MPSKTGSRCEACDREQRVGDEGWESCEMLDWCPECWNEDDASVVTYSTPFLVAAKPLGPWVSYDDYAGLEAERDQLQQDLERLLGAVKPFLVGETPPARSPEQRRLFELAQEIEDRKEQE